MGLKIYREINNSNNDNIDKSDNNILLEFVCNVDLWDSTDIFGDCLSYDNDSEEFYSVSEACHDTLKDCVEYLKRKIDYATTNQTYATSRVWLQEAQRCYEILHNELNDRTYGFYILFII